MTKHLSETEIGAWVLGERPAALAQHVAHCGECARSTAELPLALARFREAARQWSADLTPAIPTAAERPSRQPSPRWAWAVAAVALLSVSVPAWDHYARQREVQAAVASSSQASAQDAALLMQVDAQISRAVPGPMEPLVTLVSWNTGSAEHK